MDPICNIDSLPDEVLIEVFKYLTHNELARLSRVNKRWNECAKSPVLWKKVIVKLSWLRGSQNEITSSFAKKFSPSITYMKLDYWIGIWKKGLQFEQHCVKLKEMCPNLHTLILHRALLSVDFSSFMNLCNDCLPNLTALIVNSCEFACNPKQRRNLHRFVDSFREIEREYGGHKKIEIFDLANCENVPRYCMYSISKMPRLRKLNLSFIPVTDNWLGNEGMPFHLHNSVSSDEIEFSTSYLHELQCLHLGNTNISTCSLKKIKKYAPNLTELYLCNTELYGDDFKFDHSVLPSLKTICISQTHFVEGDGVVCLLQSCPSLENIYVDVDMGNSYAEQPFAAANPSMSQIVKVGNYCRNHEKIEFMLD